MASLRLDLIAEKTKGKIMQGSSSQIFSKFNIDSRLTQPGELFFAIKAQRNGHDFVPHALQNGASGAVISQEVSPAPEGAALIKVNDTLKSLQELASYVLSEHNIKVIGITGSNGKTTTKEFTNSLISGRFRVLKSEGNYNNHLGLPLTLLKLEKQHEIAVLEMGMSAPGEIRALTRIAPPDVSVITNINPVHLEFFPSLEEIAQAKKEILEGTKEQGIAVLNGDDTLVKKIGEDWSGNKIYFGLSGEDDIQARSIDYRDYRGMTLELCYRQTQQKVHFPFFYESYLYDLLAASGIALALSLRLEDIAPQISQLKPYNLRGTLIRLGKNIRLINDSYNSNPNALESALKGLAVLPSKRKIAVLGDMLELGAQEADFHFQAGKQVAEQGWDLLVGIGPLSQHTVQGALSSGMKRNQTFLFQNSEEAAEKVFSLVQEEDLILVKGSRRMKTDKIVEYLKKKIKAK
jgi:UDP-N-acetylmuramoyl-tripeptide--D-alanyl-D-alanine ligase